MYFALVLYVIKMLNNDCTYDNVSHIHFLINILPWFYYDTDIWWVTGSLTCRALQKTSSWERHIHKDIKIYTVSHFKSALQIPSNDFKICTGFTNFKALSAFFFNKEDLVLLSFLASLNSSFCHRLTLWLNLWVSELWDKPSN